MTQNEVLDRDVAKSAETKNTPDSFTDLVKIQFFDKDNSVFYKNETGFVCLKAYMPPIKKDDLDEEVSKEPEWQDLGRVYFHRAFPFDLPDAFISVQDRDGKEYGIIRELNQLDDYSAKNVHDSLERKYFIPTITKICSLKEKFGYSYWSVETDKGNMEITLRDTFRSIAKISDTHIIITDINGNRYNIPDTDALDHSSYKKIELYL